MTTGSSDAKRVRILSATLLAVVFLAGSLTGAATLDVDGGPAGARRMSVETAPWPSELELSPGQRARFDEIMTTYQPAVDSIVQTAMRDLRNLMDSVHVEVRGLLSPDQLLILDSLMVEGPRVQAVRRTLGPDGDVIEADTIR